MKISLILFLLIFSHSTFGQKVFTSHATQHFPSTEVESIDRVITIDKEKITIKSIKDDKVNIQTLRIVGKVTNYDQTETFEVYKCLSRNGRAATTVMLKKDKPRYITLHQPSLTQPDTYLEYKFLLD